MFNPIKEFLFIILFYINLLLLSTLFEIYGGVLVSTNLIIILVACRGLTVTSLIICENQR